MLYNGVVVGIRGSRSCVQEGLTCVSPMQGMLHDQVLDAR
jgi:hypothetical protein